VLEQIQRIYSRSAHKDNLRIWGKLFVSKTGRTVGGWLIDSWSEGGAPYWPPKSYWLDKKEDKLYQVQMNLGLAGASMNMGGEATDIEPDRAKFIRATLDQWELEWLVEEGKKL